MNLIRTSVLSFIATTIKVFAGLVINKFVAVTVGPSGIGVIGQFQNFIQISLVASSGAINTGLTANTAKQNTNKDKLSPLFSTAAKFSLATSLLVSGLLIVFSETISSFLFDTSEYRSVIIVFGCTTIFFVTNSFLISILNGLKQIELWTIINITQSLVSLILSVLLINFFGLLGVLLAMAANQSVVFFIIIYLLKDNIYIRVDKFINQFDPKIFKRLSKYIVMALVSSISLPVSLLAIRAILVQDQSWNVAGYWQGVWYISSTYIMIITTTLATYYLPTMASLKDKSDIYRELKNGYLILIPITCAAAAIIFLGRDIIIELLFDSSFYRMRDLIPGQLIGDVLKVSSWLIGYFVMARGFGKIHVFSELFFSAIFVGSSMYFVEWYGVIGVIYSYILTYSIYLFGFSPVIFFKLIR